MMLIVSSQLSTLPNYLFVIRPLFQFFSRVLFPHSAYQQTINLFTWAGSGWRSCPKAKIHLLVGPQFGKFLPYSYSAKENYATKIT